MPLRTYRHIILEADTRTLEVFTAFCSGGWALWLYGGLLGNNLLVSSAERFWHSLQGNGGLWLWFGWAAFDSIVQFLSAWWRYPVMRRWASSFAAVYWLLLAWTIGHIDGKLFAAHFALLMACGELWIVLHRSAIGPQENNGNGRR